MQKRYAIPALVLLAAVGAGAVQYLGLLAPLQEQLFDRFFASRTAGQGIVILAIDDETIDARGGWPLQRRDFATVLSNLGAPRAVGIDISFSDASSNGAADDAAFARALAASTVPVTLATQYDDRGGKLITPLPALAAGAGQGYANMLVDPDGILRTFEPVRGETVSLSNALTNVEHAFPRVVRIDWHGPAKTFLTIPFIDAYRGTIPPSLFADKVVLIGTTANDLHDILATPTGLMPGVEVHANALATLESGKFFKDVPFSLMLALIALAAITAAATILLTSRLVLLIALLAAELFAINLVSIALFASHVRLPALSLSLSFLLSGAFVFIYQYLNESRQRKEIRAMFQYYLMPEVIEELAAHPERLTLGGREEKLTILFSDIRGFTTISEGLSASELTLFINAYLTAMTDAIMGAGGLVDKYIGDAVMAFWGAPVANLEQEKDACRGAIAMIRALDSLNAELATRSIPPIRIGIGLSTGEVVVGNMGSARRFNYTVMGDEVNFASRIEGLTKEYGVSCILGERTAGAIKGDPSFTVRELDRVMVKGKKEPRAIYELVTDSISSKRKEQLTHFATGRAAYVQGEWTAAAAAFKAALALGEDGPSRVFLERTEELAKAPPKDWQGVWEFTTK